VPLETWFDQRLPDFFHDTLGEAGRLADVGIDPSAVVSLMDVYAKRRRQDHCRRLWALAVLDRTLHRLGAAPRAA
jgi:hypothetical protein